MDYKYLFFALGALAILFAILPAKYDPAIRLKEWSMRKWKSGR
jgi:hypothetical protein